MYSPIFELGSDQASATVVIVCALAEEQSGVDQTVDLMGNAGSALCNALDDLADMIGVLRSEQYSQTGLDGFSSSLGAHARHCLDHVEALLCGLDVGEVFYDRRVRGTEAEFDREHALLAIGRLQERLRARTESALPSELRVVALSRIDGEEESYSSSGAREVLYVFHHTVHHLALMAAQATCMGVSMDGRVGRAPATLAADHAD